MIIHTIGDYRMLLSSTFLPPSLTGSSMESVVSEGSKPFTNSTGLSNRGRHGPVIGEWYYPKQEYSQELLPPGTPYSYAVKATFKGSSGTGSSVGARVRIFHFTKK